MTNIVINVKYNVSSSFTIEVDTDWNIWKVKREISKRIKLPPEEIQLIFTGYLLKNDAILKDVSICNCTVIHAFQQKPLEVTAKFTTVDSQDLKCGKVNRDVHHFFVYCKEQCQSLCPGKLRVKCGNCCEGHIVLQREPENFDDVMKSGMLQCECKSEGCQGNLQSAQFYFKCASHSSEFDTAPVLRHIRPNKKNIECLTCSTVSSPLLVFPCDKSHVMCIECFRSYGIVRLNDRMFIEDVNHGYSLPCPVGCENSLLQDAHHFYLLGEEQYERYKRFGTEEYVLQNNGVLCPFPGCGAGILIENSCKQVVCHNCRFEFCKQCLNSYHGSSECRQQLLEDNTQDFKVDEERELRARWDQESLATIEEISKPCPGCCTKTERDGGCMHMHCSRCQMDWCWLCDREWNRECQGNHWFG
ncbi:E3 ubiquitin-protein ligase parkin-like isoform X2 [Mytilus trossulus]|uniref:E3 ubiquitin-protein ligase parkin-like isoform X1 n=1 Tax=Mytilus trossulus TaxID=6551 RepID=UPI0030041DE7